jgi:hypothetical protein
MRQWVWIGGLVAVAVACRGADPKDTAPTGATDTEESGPGTDSEDTGPRLPDGDPDTVELAGECPLEERFGGFVVSGYEAFTFVDGGVTGGVVPLTVLDLVLEAGDCEIRQRTNPSCDPACLAGEVCDDGVCVPYPEDQDLGTVEILGLAQPVAMEPITPGYSYFDTTLPHPAWEVGALIQLEMLGGNYGPLTLHGVGPEALATPTEPWVLVDDQDLIVTWDPPAAPSRALVELSIDIDQHGATPGQARCLFEDDGEGAVPAAIVSKLIDLGVSGFPSGTLSRQTADHGAIGGDGCMDFVVGTPRDAEVDVSGYTPCVSDLDCPDGQTCNLELELCE